MAEIDREKVIKGWECCSKSFNALKCNSCPYDHYGLIEECTNVLAQDSLFLLKEQEAVVRCKDCKNWIPGYITDQDDFIPPKCGKYQQMVGHSNDDFCSLAEKREGR